MPKVGNPRGLCKAVTLAKKVIRVVGTLNIWLRSLSLFICSWKELKALKKGGLGGLIYSQWKVERFEEESLVAGKLLGMNEWGHVPGQLIWPHKGRAEQKTDYWSPDHAGGSMRIQAWASWKMLVSLEEWREAGLGKDIDTCTFELSAHAGPDVLGR